MILRRVIEHFRKQEWTAIAIDFVIVVVGVFVGIQVSNWNAKRIAASDAEAYLARIADDISGNRDDLEGLARYYRQTREHGENALAALDKPAEALGGPFLIDLYQTTQIAPRSTRRDAYDEMLAAGLVNENLSLDLRRRLANYYVNEESFAVVVRNVPPLRERVRTVMPLDAQRAVRAACPETLAVDSGGATVASLPADCAIDLPPEAVARAVLNVKSAPRLAEDLSRHVADLDQKVEILELMISRNDDLAQFLVEQRR